VPRGFQDVKVPRLRDNGPDGGENVSLRHRPLLPPGNAPGTHFSYRLSRPQSRSAIGRIPLTSTGIEPKTFRFVVQHLNHCATAVPIYYIIQFDIHNGMDSLKYRVIYKSVKHFKNSQQINYPTDHGSSYADRERKSPSFFLFHRCSICPHLVIRQTTMR